ncbi:MAG: DUF4215 domain-containing protein [bacterium]
MKRLQGLLVGFATIVVACGGSEKIDVGHENPPGWEVGNVEVADGVIVVPDDMDVTVRSHSLAFAAADIPRLGSVQEGTILVSGRDMGFLRRVTAVSEAGEEVLYDTENASLAETFVSADVAGAIPLAFEGEQASQKDIEFGVDFSGHEIVSSGGVTLTLSQAGVSFSPSMEIDFSIANGALEQLRLEIIGQLDLALAAQLSVSASGTYSRDITLWESSPVVTTIWVGVVPVVLVTRLKLEAGFGLTAEGSMSLEAGAAFGSTVTLGAQYLNGSWTPISTTEFEVTPIGPTLDLHAGAGLRVYLRPSVECKLYEVAGPKLALEPYGQFTASLLPPPPGWELSAGIAANLSVRLEVMDHLFADWSHTLFDLNWPLASGTFVGCEDQDGDQQNGRDPVTCPDGPDFCDNDPNNWTQHACQYCVDNDADGYGVDCDRGDDCDDADPGIHEGCPLCGNGVVDHGEECDDGNVTAGDGCSDTCTLEVAPGCGNGVLEYGEGCDDGNPTDCDGCSAQCAVEACGNGVPECAEECDDGNTTSGDGCTAACGLEVAPGCGNGVLEPGEACDDGNATAGDGCSPTCTVEAAGTCGDGAVHPTEGCDDGNVADCDGCSAQCAVEGCGNGVPECAEACDDGNTVGGDGCSATCTLEVAAGCGNGVLEPGEECDDGNLASGDGCSAACQLEGATDCGNGTQDAGEECDDGNNVNGDGCTAHCRIEVPGICITDYLLACGDSHAHNNGGPGATQHIHDYGCSGWVETGPEYAYTFTAQVNGQVTATLSDMTEDLDLFVLSDLGTACDTANSCLDMGDTTVSWAAAAGSTYYLVVDGYQGAVGDYQLSVTCGVCGDGNLDPGEDCDDGNTVDGDGCDSACMYEVVGSCTPATTIQCGATVNGNNGAAGSTDAIDLYSCGGWAETGPEYAYTFVAPASQNVSVEITNSNALLDVYVLEELGGGCLADDCLDYSDWQVTWSATAGTTYYIVMEGFQGDVGDYTLQVTCN